MRGAATTAAAVVTGFAELGRFCGPAVVEVVATATVGVGLTNVTLQAFGEFLSASNGDVVALFVDELAKPDAATVVFC